MKLGIIIHSQSGNTAHFARILGDRLRNFGIEYTTALLRTKGIVKPSSKDVSIRNMPDVSELDVIVLGGPVWAFNISPVVSACIKKLPNLSGKTVIPVVTYGLPFSFMGANRALNNMKKRLDFTLANVADGQACHYFLKPNKKLARYNVESIIKTVNNLDNNS